MKNILFFVVCSTVLWSCGGKKADNTSDKNSDKKEQQSSEDAKPNEQESTDNNANNANPISEGEKIRAERKKKGDTLAIPYADLLKMMPSMLEGYKAEGDPEGSTIGMGGGSYSVATKTYKNGEKSIKISITDYNSAGEIFDTFSAMWGGMSSESKGEKTQGFKDAKEPIAGMETYNKNSKEAKIIAGVGHRFLVDINADEQESIDLTKKVFRALPLSELVKK